MPKFKLEEKVDDNLTEAYQEMGKFALSLLDKNISAVHIASLFVTTGLSWFRTCFQSSKEYDEIAKTIYDTRWNVKPIKFQDEEDETKVKH